MLLSELVAVSERVSGTSKRGEKTAMLADYLGQLGSTERTLGALFLAGALRQRKLGVGFAQLRPLLAVPPSEQATLSLAEVDRTFEELSEVRGAGSSARRSALLQSLFARATRPEQAFLVKLMLGELRQGALESIVLEAIARAAQVRPELLRRARMLAEDLVQVTAAAFEHGEAGLARFDLQLFRPVLPMLAEPAEDVSDALSQLGRAAFELKLDGARVQVHKRDSEVRVYTRSLNEVTDAVPEVVELLSRIEARELVLDGEVIALRPDGRPFAFQDTMRRFGRKLDVHVARTELPLSSFFFDCLYADGESLLDRTTEERVSVLARVVPEAARVERIVTDRSEEAEVFFQRSIARGHEGIMAKALAAPYAAGSRGASWLKIKRAHTLDLVVLAAEWGSGRRTGFLSNLHLGARDAERGGYVMLGKTFKGLTDELLAWQTQELLARETSRDRSTVYVRPELVVEIAFNDVQTSPRYPGGLALRFARVKGYRPDKRPEDADTIASVRAIHAQALGG